MNYKELLRKYIKATEEAEGVPFSYYTGSNVDVDFTDEEIDQLRVLSDSDCSEEWE